MKYYSPKVEIVHLSTNDVLLNSIEDLQNEKLGSTPGYWEDLLKGQSSI